MRKEIDFLWDDEKARINRMKHGIRFETAALVFDDDFRMEIPDWSHSLDEERFITIGSAGDVLLVLFVVYTAREDGIRLISARKATKKERELYYAGKDYT